MRKLLSNRGLNWSLFDQGLVSGVNFLSTIVVAILLGADDFGLFATLWLLLLFINSTHTALIVFPMMTLVPKQEDKCRYFGSLLIQQIAFLLLSLVLTCCVLLLYLEYVDVDLNLESILSFLLLLTLYHMHDFYRRYFFSISNYGNAFVIDLLAYFTRLLVLVAAYIFKYELGISDVFLIFSIAYFIGIIFGARRYDFMFDSSHIVKDLKQHWELSKWLLPSGLMQWTSVNLYIVGAAIILGPVSVGVIRVGQNIVAIFNVVIQGVENHIPVEASGVYKKSGISSLYKYLVKVVLIGVAFVFIVEIFAMLFSDEIILYLYGEKYIEASNVVVWYSFILIFVFVMVPIRVFLRTISRTKIWFNSYVMASLFSLVMFYPLVKEYGVDGVMMGMLFTYIILLVSVVVMIFKEKDEYDCCKK